MSLIEISSFSFTTKFASSKHQNTKILYKLWEKHIKDSEGVMVGGGGKYLCVISVRVILCSCKCSTRLLTCLHADSQITKWEGGQHEHWQHWEKIGFTLDYEARLSIRHLSWDKLSHLVAFKSKSWIS